MTEATSTKWGAGTVALAPALLYAGFLYHPPIGDPTDPGFLARLGSAVEAVPVRWAISHLMVALGSAAILLAFLVIRSRLRQAGENRWSAPAVPFIVMGSMLYALLPAMEFGPLAGARAGFDPAAVQGALFPWFIPILFSGAVLFLIGVVGFAKAVARSGILPARAARVVAGALVVMAVARLVPLSLVQFHLQGIAGLVAMAPLSSLLWSEAARAGAGAGRGEVAGRYAARGVETP